MTCFLAEAANSFNVGTSFAKMSRISTPEAGGFLFLRFGSFGLCVINFLHRRRRLTVYGFLCYFGCFFHFLSHSDGVAKLQFIVLSLKSVFKTASLSTEQINLVRKASSNGSLMSCILSYSACQFRNSFARFAFHVRPKLETFSDNKSFWVELLCHKRLNIIHR